MASAESQRGAGVIGRIRRAVTWRAKLLEERYLERTQKLPEITLERLTGATTPMAPLIADQICMPPHRFDAPKHDDYTAIMAVARRVNPAMVVELGTAHGNTVANLCAALPGTNVVTVNAPVTDQSGSVVTFELTEAEIGSVYRNHGFGDRVEQVFCNTLDLDLGPLLNGTPIDLAVIDACHDERFVLNDFSKVAPFVRPGGVVLFHDTHPSLRGHLKGSTYACMRLRRKGHDIRHITDTWWGIWCNGDMESLCRR